VKIATTLISSGRTEICELIFRVCRIFSRSMLDRSTLAVEERWTLKRAIDASEITT